jgi:hypothetical protein
VEALDVARSTMHTHSVIAKDSRHRADLDAAVRIADRALQGVTDGPR